MPIIGVAWEFDEQVAALANRIGYPRMQLPGCRISEYDLEFSMLLNRYGSPIGCNPVLQILTMSKGTVLESAAGQSSAEGNVRIELWLSHKYIIVTGVWIHMS
ncbi:hypothetical protein D3C85_1645710 [compost metagenome]